MTASSSFPSKNLVDFNQNFFEIFQLPVDYRIDEEELSVRYRALQQSVHPDKYASATDQEKRLSVQWATKINEAFDTLREPLSRAIYLLRLQDISIENNPTLDSGFLMEQIELREELEEIETQGDAGLSTLEAYKQEVLDVMSRLQDEFSKACSNDIAKAEYAVYKMQFINRLIIAADRLEEKRLDY
ncbi:MAG: Fe-S protein assembly co-chaperone HscB [Gammaproteobacteria bacterium]|nr:Fe-S protein assembly co-chaperone HscB [Gammaproteobacteria bacterium]